MIENVETVFRDLHQVVAEVEKLLAASAGTAPTEADEAVTSWRNSLKSAQDRLAKVQHDTRQTITDAAHTAAHALHGIPWKSVAIAAAAGLALGLALGNHGDSHR